MSNYVKKEKPLESLLPYTNPEILTHWDYERNSLDPTILTSGKSVEIFLTQSCGHYWSVSLSNQSRKNKVGCPYCLNVRLLKGFNDLESQRPDLVAEIDFISHPDLDPSEITMVSRMKLTWIKESCGHSWETSVNMRYQGAGCVYCSSQRVLVGFNDFHSHHPKLSEEWGKDNTFKPTEYTKTSGQSVWWDGLCGHSWKTGINNRVSGKNCPYCSNRKILEDFNDLFSVSESAGLDWNRAENPKTASETLGYTRTPGSFICLKGHNVKESIEQRVLRGTCSICNRSYSGFETSVARAISEKYPDLELRTHFRFEEDNGKKLEIDIYIESLKLGIEVQDFWSHSKTVENEKFTFGVKKGPIYHLNKIEKAKSFEGIDLIEIWEDEIKLSDYSRIFSKINEKLDKEYFKPKRKSLF